MLDNHMVAFYDVVSVNGNANDAAGLVVLFQLDRSFGVI